MVSYTRATHLMLSFYHRFRLWHCVLETVLHSSSRVKYCESRARSIREKIQQILSQVNLTRRFGPQFLLRFT